MKLTNDEQMKFVHKAVKKSKILDLRDNGGQPDIIDQEFDGSYLEDVTGEWFYIVCDSAKIYSETINGEHYSVYRVSGLTPIDVEEWHRKKEKKYHDKYLPKESKPNLKIITGKSSESDVE